MKARERSKKQVPAKDMNAGGDIDQAGQPNSVAGRVKRGKLRVDKVTEVRHQKDTPPTIDPVPQADGSPTSKLDVPNERENTLGAIRE